MSDHRTVLAVRKSLTIDGVERQVFVASTAASDRMDDVIDQASWKLDNYRQNPVVLTDHDYRAGNVVGRGEVQVVEGVGLVLDVVKWSSKEYAQAVKLDVEEGIINAVSVGLRPGRRVARRSLPSTDPLYLAEGYGEVYYDCDLLEISIVAVPANPEAVAVRAAQKASADEIADALLDKLAHDPPRRAILRDMLANQDSVAHLFAAEPADEVSSLSHLFGA